MSQSKRARRLIDVHTVGAWLGGIGIALALSKVDRYE